jgi:glutathione S-transferase
MITLYELHWSHYCEKIRLALDYMGLAWKSVDINAFRKSELAGFPLPAHLPNYTVPAIWDESAQRFVMDSTPVLRYLDQTYPDAPKLFPGDGDHRAAIDAQLLEFDTLLSLPARRFGYSQVILECPAVLSDLFLSRIAGGLLCLPVLRTLSGHFLGIMLSKRFDFHCAEKAGLYEALERYLLALAARLEGKTFVSGQSFSVADLALAAQLRPLTIVPFFAEHPKLQGLFDRHRSVLKSYSREGDSLYQKAIAAVRLKKMPMRRHLVNRCNALPFAVHEGFAANDQQRVWTRTMWTMPFHYFVTLRAGKIRQLEATETVR